MSEQEQEQVLTWKAVVSIKKNNVVVYRSCEYVSRDQAREDGQDYIASKDNPNLKLEIQPVRFG